MQFRTLKLTSLLTMPISTVLSGSYASGTCTMVRTKAEGGAGKVRLNGNILRINAAGNVKLPTVKKCGRGFVLFVFCAHTTGTVQLKDSGGTSIGDALPAGCFVALLYDIEADGTEVIAQLPYFAAAS